MGDKPQPQEKKSMKLNDFVPPNKARSVKLNARNLQQLQMDTVTLNTESKDMEEKLQQLKDNMSKEKVERGHSRQLRWAFGQSISSNSNFLPNHFKKNKDNKMEKLSASKVKIRVLKDESLTAPSQPQPPLSVPHVGVGMARRDKQKKNCGQCGVKPAGFMCSECTENHCTDCFSRCHQKGTLKLHSAAPTQTDLLTHEGRQDMVSCTQGQIISGSFPSTFNPSSGKSSDCNHTITSSAITRQMDGSTEKGTKVDEKLKKFPNDCSLMLLVKNGQEEKVGVTREETKGLGSPLLNEEYNEEVSARSFQEVLMQWRGERRAGGGQTMAKDGMWKPVRPVLVSAAATQADLPPDREAEGQRREGAEEKLTVKVEFTENSLTYMDRLLLKKHRRTPIERNPSLDFAVDVTSLTTTDTKEETTNGLTAEEEDFHHYCASLFAVPVSRSGTEPQISTPESLLVIEVLDEERDAETCRDIIKVCSAEQKTNTEVSIVQQIFRKEQTLMSHTTISSGFFKAEHTSPSSMQPSKNTVHFIPAKKLHLADHQTPKPEQSDLSSKSTSSTYPLSETPGRPKKSVKTPTSQSSRSFSSHSVHKPKANYGSPQFLSPLPHSKPEISKSTQSPALFLADLSTLDDNVSEILKKHPSPSSSASFSLRSTFRVLPSSSTQYYLLPKVYHSASQQKGADSSSLSEHLQSSQLFAETISSLELWEASTGNLFSPQQSQHSLSDLELRHPLSPVSARTQPQPKSLKSILPINSPMQCHGAANSFRASELKFREVINDLAKTDMDNKLSVDSGDEMSNDSLSLAPHEDDFSDEEAQMRESLRRKKSTEKEDSAAVSQLEDFFVPAETDLQNDKPEQQSEPLMVMQHQSVGPGSEQFCDLDQFSPLGLDTNTGYPNSPEYERCDRSRSCRHSVRDSNPTASNSWSHNLRCCAEEHLVLKEMDSYIQPMEIQIHSTRREEMSANELGTSEARSNLSEKSTPIPTDSPRRNSRLTSASASHHIFHSPSPPLPACLSHPTLGSWSGPSFRSYSSVAQEIMEICNVDQTGCEDPGMDTETTEHLLHSLEQELKLMANTESSCTHLLDRGNSGFQNQHEIHLGSLTWDGVSEEQIEDEEATERDRQSVLLLP